MAIDPYKRETWHAKVTNEAVLDAAQRQISDLDDPGFCLACGFECDGVEPDAERYTCEQCGEPQVYGASQLLIYSA